MEDTPDSVRLSGTDDANASRQREREEAGVGVLGFWLSRRGAGDDQHGASLVEDALLLALIALVCVGAMQLLGNDVSTRLSTFGGSLTGS